MQFGSVCSGIEAATVAWHELGWRAAWLAEIDKFASAVLAHHYPAVPNLGDMTKIARGILTGEVPAPDVLCGGTPCQAFSVAGLRESLADARGNLTIKFVEIANAIDHVRAGRGEDECVVFWENVPGVLSTKDNAFGCFLAGLAGEDEPLQPPGGKWANAGAVYGPRRAVAWRTLDAQYFGVAQRRRRVFVVASARKWFDPATVLFEWDGVRRDTAPSRETRQTAPTIPARSTAGGGLGTDFDCDGVLQVAGTMKACKDSGGWSHSADHAAAGYMIPVETLCVATGQAGAEIGAEIGADMAQTLNCNHEAPYVAHSLRGEGFDASQDGTGRGTPLVPVGVTIHGTDPTVQKVASYDELAQCLRARTPGNIDNSSTTVVQQPVAFQETADCLTAAYGTKWNGNASATNGSLFAAQPVAYGIRTANTSSNGWGIQEEVTHTLDCAQGVAVAQFIHANKGRPEGRHSAHTEMVSVKPLVETLTTDGHAQSAVFTPAMQVRRLTPEECEALQGFPRSYTAIPWRGKPADQCPDGPRYKALGNSWAVPNVTWLGRRIQAALRNS